MVSGSTCDLYDICICVLYDLCITCVICMTLYDLCMIPVAGSKQRW